ncbi:caspase family protein [Flammeovirga sp. EKP202]|uniref:caspase family protein n=1 Tax=Flammeovirga sp. EKP202 TaxID=2770592 RepID=UPI00165F8375|nr:caspase family protein [Flammeovirga sp. EKP202]MBD0404962.1 caspase family protein [Flammeovirga sp. EKP202]
MKKTILLVFIAITFLLQDASAKKIALVIGIDKYVPDTPTGETLTWRNLNGAVRDANAMSNVLKCKYQFDVIKVLDTPEETTTKGLKEAFKWLQDNTKANDIVFFYYAGHGSQVENSRHFEADKTQECIVPSDAYKGKQNYILDTELNAFLLSLTNKKAMVTAIFDSCHSGSVSRNAITAETPATRSLNHKFPDIKTSVPKTIPPATRGALIISAAQNNETASETVNTEGLPQGAFTDAFLQAINASPSVENVATLEKRIRSLLRFNGKVQTPTFEGQEDRMNKALFGENVSSSDNPLLFVEKVNSSSGEIKLLGGAALKINKGTTLKNNKGIELEISSLDGMTGSYAKVTSGSLSNIKEGDAFEVKVWAHANHPNLVVYASKSSLSDIQITGIGHDLQSLNSSSFKIIKPWEVGTHTLAFNESTAQWVVSNTCGQQKVIPNPTPAVVKKAVTGLTCEGNSNVKLFVNLPLSSGKYKMLDDEFGESATKLSKSSIEASYILGGFYEDGKLKYAWTLQSANAQSEETRTLPTYADPVNVNSQSFKFNLTDQAQKIGALKKWMTLRSPASMAFPYKLCLQDLDNGSIIDGGKIYEGQNMRLAFKKDPALFARWKKRNMFLYVFMIDDDGEMQLLLPFDFSDNKSDNILQGYEKDVVPVDLEGNYIEFTVEGTGVDKMFVLASEEAIPNPEQLFNINGVRSTRSGVGGDPLVNLLNSINTNTRGLSMKERKVKAVWSISSTTFESSLRQ